MSRLKLGKTLLLGSCGLTLLLLLLVNYTESTVFAVLAILFPFIGAGAWILLGRCPDCGRFLGRADGRYCPRCGAKLEQ